MNFNQNLTITKYNGNLPFVNKIVNLIERKYSDLFHAVIVHGSVATNEVIAYSDFDGLLIVKDQYVNSKQLKDFKKESMKVILSFDPLQHHGWFQIKESELLNYPQSYFPYQILTHSKLLYPNIESLNFKLMYDKKQISYKTNLLGLVKNIEAQINLNWEDQRIYELKSFLSKIMLLPSMCYSVKNNEGINKKSSFKLVKNYFEEKEWKCIEIATKIRHNWNSSLTPVERMIMTQPNKIFRRMTKKYIAPKINRNVLQDLNEDFFISIKLLLKKIHKEII